MRENVFKTQKASAAATADALGGTERTTPSTIQELLLSQTVHIEALRAYVKLTSAFNRGDSPVEIVELLLQYANDLRSAYSLHGSSH
ncbi:hypothetical protein FRC0141_00188 [Corynebacterium diphtheriae]|nr:hypothetical protein B11Q_00152 [Corynebacterium diphtheriae]CAB0533242.1 hypothetical protein CIP107523_00136 [Corynebacterium diphtheriae]CAB0533428.1 hypothetical protein CIP107527_00142 [Corynebacterium diphtheriae]CAB0535214.1 hypothetical protein CIP107529_00262 [Corynebacterium diphtheriae]CAB0578960.1 hypothetical protein CIP107550_00135 [Corynebacterium diphtheriae]